MLSRLHFFNFPPVKLLRSFAFITLAEVVF